MTETMADATLCALTARRLATRGADATPLAKRSYFAGAYFAGLSRTLSAQSLQHTTMVLPLTFTDAPLSLISQSHTGHFFAGMIYSSLIAHTNGCRGHSRLRPLGLRIVPTSAWLRLSDSCSFGAMSRGWLSSEIAKD